LIPLPDTRIVLYTNSFSVADMTTSRAGLENHEQCTELLDLASREQDQEKLGALFEEILYLLERQAAQLDANPHRS
jgi:hypothetical protein